MKTDVLSETLMKTKLSAFVTKALDAGGNWAVEFPDYEGIKFNVVLKGECWLSIKEKGISYNLKTGDCFLMSGGKPFILAKDLSIKRKARAEDVMEAAKDGVATYNGGGDFLLIGALFQFEGHLPKIMFEHLPPVIHIPENLEQAAVLRWSLERFSAEFRSARPGRSLILNHLAPIMLLQTLRIYLASTKDEKNWLIALADPKLSKVIEAMHSDYQRNWSVEELAKVAGMSRSGFALKFKKQVGSAPMDYLANWRMQVACELLRTTDKTVAAVANAVGYESESAFSFAFKKILKCRPGVYQSNAHFSVSTV